MNSVKRQPSAFKLFVTLALAIVHLLAGFSILLVSSWFIAACSIAGVGFNYMLPAVVIRALALIRISSGYFSMLVGHYHLLSNLAMIRLNLFASLENKVTVSRQSSLDALNHQSEEVASIWISWVGQNAGALLSLVCLNVISFIFIPSISNIIVLFSGAFVIIYCVLLWSMIQSSSELVSAKEAFQFDMVKHIECASLWHLYQEYDVNPPRLRVLIDLEKKLKLRVRLAAFSLFVAAIACISVIFSLYSAPLLGNPIFVLIPITLLSINDWLSPTLNSLNQLLKFKEAKKAIDSTSKNLSVLKTNHASILGFELRNFRPCNTRMNAINARFNSSGAHIITGGSGSGKSRFLQALMGLIPFEGNRGVLTSNTTTNLLSTTNNTLLTDCFYVEQFPYILSDTLRSNLLIVNTQATENQLIHCLNLVGLGHLRNLEEWLGENGRQLSGGEMKRIGLARALLSKSSAILIDEPFEALDQSNIRLVVKLLNKLAMEKIILVATHIIPKELNIGQRVSLDDNFSDIQSNTLSTGVLKNE